MSADTYYKQEDAAPDLQQTVVSLETALAQSDPATAQTLMDEAQLWLGSLYDDAQQRSDGNAMLAVTESWNRLQTIKQQVDLSAATARAAVAGMRTASEQRDQIAGELAELTEAVVNMDSDHPLVSDLMESLEEQFSDVFHENGLHVDCPGCAVGEQGFPINHDAMNYLCMTLFGDAEDISGGLKEELAVFIHAWVKKAQAEEDASGHYSWRVTPDNIDEFPEDEDDEFEDDPED